jgi:hypothetical protein
MQFTKNKLLDHIVCDMTRAAGLIDDLFAMGYSGRFELVGNKLMDLASGDVFYPHELTVDYLHHVPGIGYVYGIRYDDMNIKGIFVYYTVDTITLR